MVVGRLWELPCNGYWVLHLDERFLDVCCTTVDIYLARVHCTLKNLSLNVMFCTRRKKKNIHILLLFIYVNDSYEKKPRVLSQAFFISWTLKGILHPIFWRFVRPALNSWNSFSGNLGNDHHQHKCLHLQNISSFHTIDPIAPHPCCRHLQTLGWLSLSHTQLLS